MSRLFRLQPSGRLRPEHLIDTGYRAGTLPAQEAQEIVAANRRYVRLSGVAADVEYSFEVSAFRIVDVDVNPVGQITSVAARMTRGKFRPATTTKLAGIEAGATRGAIAGANLFRADGATVLTQAEIRTAEGTAAAISGQGPGATAGAADVLNSFVPSGDANRVPFSRMEGGQGWSFSTAMTVTTALRPVQVSGRTFIRANTTASGAQTAFLNSPISTPIRVTGGERLSISLGIEALGPALSFWLVQLIFLDAALGTPAAPTLFQGPGNPSASVRQTAFVDVPATAVSCYFQIAWGTAGAGTYTFSIVDPMIASATAGQTIHPPYTPGPNALDGADVTLQNTAAAITGQSPWATTSIPTARVSNLSDGGAFNSLANITNRDLSLTNNRAWTNLYRANGSTPITDADAITSLGTAAAITGQSPWATTSIPTARVTNLTDTGTFNSLANITTRDLSLLNGRAWTNLYRSNGTTPITDADAITALGTAAAIANQAPAATDTTIQAGADVTAFVSGTPSHVFNYTSAGVLDPSNQLPRALDYRFNTLAGVRTTGVTWQYRIVSGNVNGFAASTTLRSMSVASGVGTLNLTAFDTNTAEIDIIGTFGTQSVTYRTVLSKAFAAPNNTGGGGGSPATASQTSGFTSIGFGQTTYMTISEVLQVTAVTTTLTATVNLSYSLDSEGTTTFEMQIERWNGSAWVAFGASESRVAFRFYDAESLELYENSANWGFTRTVTVTAATVQQVRIRLRRSSGDDMSAGGYGTFNISA